LGRQNTFLGGKIFVFIISLKHFSGHNKILGAMPPGRYRPASR